MSPAALIAIIRQNLSRRDSARSICTPGGMGRICLAGVAAHAIFLTIATKDGRSHFQSGSDRAMSAEDGRWHRSPGPRRRFA